MFKVQQVRNHSLNPADAVVVKQIETNKEGVSQARAELREDIRNGGPEAGSDWVQVR